MSLDSFAGWVCETEDMANVNERRNSRCVLCIIAAIAAAATVGCAPARRPLPEPKWAVLLEDQFWGALASDGSGNMYVVGERNYSGEEIWDFKTPSPRRACLTKIRGDGVGNWTIEFSGDGRILCQDVAVNDSGTAVVTGQFEGDIDFDPGPGSREYSVPAGDQASFACGIDGKGELRWLDVWPFCRPQFYRYVDHKLISNFEGTPYAVTLSVTSAPSHEFRVLGAFSGQVDLDPGPTEDLRTSSGPRDIFLAVFKDDGTYKHSTVIGEPGVSFWPEEVRVDNDGKAMIAGVAQLPPQADGSSSTADTSESQIQPLFIVEIPEPDRAAACRFYAVGSGVGGAAGLAVDNAGSIYVSGTCMGSPPVEVTTVSLPLTADPYFHTEGFNCTSAFLLRFDQSGNPEWIQSWGGAAFNPAGDLALGADGMIYVTGGFSKGSDLDPGPGKYSPRLPTCGDEGLKGKGYFLSSFSPQGAFEWIGSGRTCGADNDMSTDIAGNLTWILTTEEGLLVEQYSLSAFR